MVFLFQLKSLDFKAYAFLSLKSAYSAAYTTLVSLLLFLYVCLSNKNRMLNFNHLTRFTLIRLAVFGTLFSPVINSIPSYSQINVITERLRKDLINLSINYNAVSIYLQTLVKDGSWEDIDYTNTSVTNWLALSHSLRLKEICIAYNQPSYIHYHDTLVKRKIEKIIDFYIASKPISDNWWLNAIGAPINLGSALVLMKTGDSFGIDQKALEKYSDKLLNYYAESVKKWRCTQQGQTRYGF